MKTYLATDLTWEQIKRILKGIAYGLHMIHKTGQTCIVDFKPENILLNEVRCFTVHFNAICMVHFNALTPIFFLEQYDDPVICDLGMSFSSGMKIPCTSGTGTYHDYSAGMT